MESKKKKPAAKKGKRKPSKSMPSTKTHVAGPSLVAEDAQAYKTMSKKSNKEVIEKKLKALKQLSGMFAGLQPLEDAQKYVNRLRANDRF